MKKKLTLFISGLLLTCFISGFVVFFNYNETLGATTYQIPIYVVYDDPHGQRLDKKITTFNYQEGSD
ncbi:MAG: hypothetical protein MJ246_06990 [Clostridia bacterium]|nr:hypothetical protein [Clostridia bacterium]